MLDKGKIVAVGTAAELKRSVPGGHVRLRFADPAGLDAGARLLGEGTRDEEALTLQVPSDGGVTALRGLLDRLTGVEVSELSVHLPDLDDVFFALTTNKQQHKETVR